MMIITSVPEFYQQPGLSPAGGQAALVHGHHLQGQHVQLTALYYNILLFQDVKAILPTLVILFVGLLIMILVIPYAFR